jgi:hypothetical protein
MRMTLPRVKVDEIFASCTHQAEVLIDLYRLVFPDWDKIKKLHGWPKIGKVAADHIACKYREFDRQHHPGVMPMGLWMNNGFSVHGNENLDPWEVSTDNVEVEYATDPIG